jgi:hypothetical protein
MAKPLVSVGIAAYNKPDGLRRTLQCITGQTYPNLEIIVSDDCSPDEGVSRVVNEVMLTEPRIRFYRQKNNLGAALNIAFVLDKATGKYFLWADDEDLCEPEFVEKILNCMESQPDLVACACDVKTIDQQDNLVGITQLDTIRPSANWNQARKLFFCYPNSNIFLCVLGMFKTEELRKTSTQLWVGWKGYTINCEVPFLAQIAAFGRIAAIPEALKTYRLNPDSVYHSEIRSIPRFDVFMLRLDIRLRLCRIAVMCDLPILVKASLLNAILASHMEAIKKEVVIGTVMAWKGRVIRLLSRVKRLLKGSHGVR